MSTHPFLGVGALRDGARCIVVLMSVYKINVVYRNTIYRNRLNQHEVAESMNDQVYL